jgi:hypothetical protein
MEKKCCKCGLTKPVSEFHVLSRASDGLNYRCKTCCNDYYKSLYPSFKEKKIKQSRKRYFTNKDKILDQRKNLYDPIKKKDYNRNYNLINKFNIKLRKNEYEKNRIKSDSEYRLIKIMRRMVYRLLKSKKDTTFFLLGYSKDTLINWLGRLPNSDECVDHRIPVSWFIKETPITIISNYQNLQILSKSENVKKSNSYCDPVTKDFYDLSFKYIKQDKKINIKFYEF